MKNLWAGALIVLIGWLLWPASEQIKTDLLPKKGYKHFFHGDQIRALVLDHDHIWVGGLSGLKLVNWRTCEILPSEPDSQDLVLVRVEAMLSDSDGNLWVGHEQGLHRRNKDGNWQDFTSFLPDPKVLSLCAVRSNEIWVGTWRGVGIKSADNSWRHLKKEDGLPAEKVRTIYEDSKGRIWLGTSSTPEGGLMCIEDGQNFYYSTKDYLAHPNVTAIMHDSLDNLWVGTGFFDKGGVSKISGWSSGKAESVTILRQKDGLAGNKGRSLLEDRNKNIWIGSELDGLTKIDEQGKFHIYTTADGLIGDEVMAMLQDPDGNLWLGQEKGLCRIASSTHEL
ncbi:MAG: hypothetical protein PWR01_3013 [Clostridiales bacterium]|nr:hypothetical protein [Clostridiales bacterium]MDN5281940.1 hypothetical protein [Candidatus Ozemobacter sp.]